MLETFRKIWRLLDRKSRRHFVALIPASMVLGLLDIMAIIAVVPFLAIVVSPGIVEHSQILNSLYTRSGAADPRQFLYWLGYLVLGALVAGTLARWAIRYLKARFTLFLNASLTARLLSLYIHDDYDRSLGRHSAQSERMLLSEVERVTSGTVSRWLSVFASFTSIASIFAFLLVVDFWVTITISVAIAAGYGVAYFAMRGLLLRLGEVRRAANRKRFRAAKDAMSGLREVKMFGLEQKSQDQLEDACRELAHARLKVSQLGRVPRYVLEIFVLGGLVAFVLWLLATEEGALADALPTLGIYALSAMRLIPGMQMLFRGLVSLRSNRPVLDSLLAHFDAVEHRPPVAATAAAPVVFRQRLRLEDVSYSYPNGEGPALFGVSMDIAAGSRIAVVGASGAGKSTLVGILGGLLIPQTGRFLVDGQALDRSDLPSWRRTVGYVPQQVFHFDASVAENVALAPSPDTIDRDRVMEVLDIAGLSEVVQGLPQGLDTRVGERASWLSGGQSQRLALARALYRQPKVLILDEATNALDALTETQILSSISSLGGDLTVVTIAHSLNTVRHADCIYLLDHGRLQDAGTYQDLSSRNRHFRALGAPSVTNDPPKVLGSAR